MFKKYTNIDVPSVSDVILPKELPRANLEFLLLQTADGDIEKAERIAEQYDLYDIIYWSCLSKYESYLQYIIQKRWKKN